MNHSTTHSPAANSALAPRRLRATISYLIAGACLFWVFHGIHPAQLWQSLAHIRWEGLAWGVALQFAAYFCVAWEWQLLLEPVGPLPLWQAAQAVFAGRFSNDALPLQLGYLVRAILAARWLGADTISIFPSLIVERLWDGFWLAAGIGIVAMLLPLPPFVLRAAEVMGAMVAAGAVITALVVLWTAKTGTFRPKRETFRSKPLRWIFNLIQRLAGGVRNIHRPGLLAAIWGLSALKLGIQAIAFLGMLWACRLSLPAPVGLAVFLAGYVGVCVPSTPAGTGMFQLFVVGALTYFGVDKTIAAGFALVAFAAITVPLAVAGFFALAQSGLRLRDVRAQAG